MLPEDQYILSVVFDLSNALVARSNVVRMPTNNFERSVSLLLFACWGFSVFVAVSSVRCHVGIRYTAQLADVASGR